MIEKKPPEWGNDPLSTFFKDAEYNDRVTALNFPKIFDLFRRVHMLLKRENSSHDKKAIGNFNYRLLFGL